jgi:Co/Zn/Cd efflux system component
MVAMSGHVVMDGTVPGESLLATLAAGLRARFRIGHTTIQIEPPDYVEEGFHP